MSIDQVEEALDAIERHESKRLAWGLVDDALVEARVLEIISSVCSGDPTDVLRDLRRQRLLLDVPRSSPRAYRSRMAEGVRLFAQLRQVFWNEAVDHESAPWHQSPRLVADYRFLAQPRRFPIRSLSAEDLLRQLDPSSASDRGRAVAQTLLGGSDHRPPVSLSKFQVDSTTRILDLLRRPTDGGAIITAGTGSGKTLAFYLPALMHLAARPRERVLAIYPRVELLKDQLLSALRETRRLRHLMNDGTAIRIGAYFGATPLNASADFRRLGWWRPRGFEGEICPYLVCPGEPLGDACGGDLAWFDRDRSSGSEVLRCRECDLALGPDAMLLTRQSMQNSQPEILFATTEILNRSLGDEWSRHVFGVGPRANSVPRLVLLDEAHTYSGSSGAQAAFVLRRWRHLLAKPITWVGLSATLRSATGFFSDLTGVPVSRLSEVTPEAQDLQSRGHEYQLLLRGDPTSQAALLSTSIQSLMLLSRLLDPLGTSLSGGLYGQKVFAFCDNLDLVNRLFRQLLSAEGREPTGKIDDSTLPLALLRSQERRPDLTDWTERDSAGQDWWLTSRINHGQGPPPVIGRTSSQDAGVLSQAKAIVATASLEVGFDDPEVGAVLQHKAPRDLAQFVQRRGRAGRSQSMRPWTVIVLSDFGRDRLAYQGYESLLDPSLPKKTLPLGNRSILRIQATFALIDWVTDQLANRTSIRGSTWTALTSPLRSEQPKKWQAEVTQLLQAVLSQQETLADLRDHLADALGIQREEVDVLLWEGPRSLLLEAIPTALRRLESGWHTIRDGESVPGGDRIRNAHPLPEFVPGNLFSDLLLPEVAIDPPDGYDRSADTEESAFLAINQFAPGNVTLRYAVWKTRGLWIDPRAVDSRRLDVRNSLLHDSDVVATVEKGGESVPVRRPFSIRPEIATSDVGTNSRGFLDWKVRFEPVHDSLDLSLPLDGPWARLLESAVCFVQAGKGGVRVLRYATDGEATIRVNGRQERVPYELCFGREPTAVGVELDVDALAFRIRPPATVQEILSRTDLGRLRQLRRDRFVDVLAESLGDQFDFDGFLSARLGDTALAAWAARAIRNVDATRVWTQAEFLEAFDRCFPGEVQDSDTESGTRLRQSLEEVFADSDVVEVIGAHLASVTAEPDESWYPWLRRRLTQTAAAAIHSAVQTLLPDFDASDDLIVDVADGLDTHVDIWMSESAVGGGGIVEAFYERYGEDPRRFWWAASAALHPSDTETALSDLDLVVECVGHGDLKNLAAEFREERDDARRLEMWQHLVAALARRGARPTQSLLVNSSIRVLGAGSSVESDLALLFALRRRAEWEETTGVALDLRTLCGLLAEDGEMRNELSRAAPGEVRPSAQWTVNALQARLWASPESSRSNSLDVPNPFSRGRAATERTLVLDYVARDVDTVDVSDDGWRRKVDSALERKGRCELIARRGDEGQLKAAVLNLMVAPVEVLSLFLHPRIVSTREDLGFVHVGLELTEAPQ